MLVEVALLRPNDGHGVARDDDTDRSAVCQRGVNVDLIATRGMGPNRTGRRGQGRVSTAARRALFPRGDVNREPASIFLEEFGAVSVGKEI